MASDTKFKILAKLVDGDYHSGEDIGHQLNISRSAVSSHIKSLSQLGLDIFSVTGKGYKLANRINLLDRSAILAQSTQSTSLVVVQVTESTNADLMSKVRSSADIPDGHVILAEAQTSGRGRRGREWQSPFGSHIYFSQYRILDDGLAASAGLSLAVGIAVANTINSYLSDSVSLKWPNDVLYQGKKLAGILVEAEGQAEGRCHLVIGIGINVNMPQVIGEQIDQPWTDLTSILDASVDRNEFVGRLLEQLAFIFSQYKESQLQALYQQWNDMNAYKNKMVDIISPNNTKTGLCLGIDETGSLLLQLKNSNSIQRIYGVEVSLRRSGH